MKNGQLMAPKIIKFSHTHWHYHNAFTVGLRERMPRYTVSCTTQN